MQMNMGMTITWNSQCSFIFETLSTNNVPEFILGCMITAFIAFITVSFPALRAKIQLRKKSNSDNQMQLLTQNSTLLQKKKSVISKKNLLGVTVYYFFYSTLHIAVMLLIMTMNAFVILAIIVGTSIGYATFGFKCDNDSFMPVNCCAK